MYICSIFDFPAPVFSRLQEEWELQKKLCLPVPYFQTYTFCKL